MGRTILQKIEQHIILGHIEIYDVANYVRNMRTSDHNDAVF